MPASRTDSTRAARVLEIVCGAMELSTEESAAFLRTVCGEDETLRTEVESLLGFRFKGARFLERPVIGQRLAELARAAAGDLPPGTLLGGYRIVSLLGVGGMGEVYLAADTVHGRQVALKLVGQGRAEDVRGRHFRHERKALATLNHPHIARLYGSGITPDGQAYLVMEHIEGERLDRFCQERGLDVGARLALFRKVCAAVTYAHQNLVVHRDLKPANIRVTPEGEPKLLDFGIAKLLDPEGTTNPDPTVTMQGAMTPEYASPEQIKGEPITTASDVYSLGVVLFELLTGQRPFAHLQSRRPDELARAICEEEPPRPSTVLRRQKTEGKRQREQGAGPAPCSKADGSRSKTSAPSTFYLLPSAFSLGDLDNIVAKALRKEPARRYASVAAFSEDVRRHCEGLPVSARKDTPGYRLGKFVRRNKAGVAAAVLVVLALVAGLVVATWQARVALRERDRAHLAQQQAERLNAFLKNLLSSVDPSRQGKDVKVADVLDAASRNLDRELAAEPEALIQAHQTLHLSYSHLGLFVPAEEHARAAYGLERRLHGTDDPATVQAEIDLAGVLCDRYRFDEATPLLRHALAVLRRQSVPDQAALAKTLDHLSYSFSVRGQAAQAEPFLADALTHARAAWSEQSSDYANILNDLGNVKFAEGDYAAAESIYRRLVAIQDQLGPGGEHSIAPLLNLCICLFDQEKPAEARQMINRMERDSRRLFGEKSLYYAFAIYGHGVADATEGNYQTAIPLLQGALPVLTAVYPAGQTTVVQCRAELGLCLTRTGRAAEGEPLLRAALADGGQVGRQDFAHTCGNLETALGECLLAQGRYAEAEPLCLTGRDDLEKRLGPQNRFTLRADQRLHDLYSAGNKPAEAARFDHGATAQTAPAP